MKTLGQAIVNPAGRDAESNILEKITENTKDDSKKRAKKKKQIQVIGKGTKRKLLEK